MRKKQSRTIAWQGHVESLEPRAVMSADPLAQLTDVAIEHQTIDELPSLVQHVDLATPDFWITPEDQAKIVQASSGISPMLASAHATTGWNTVQTNYGFNGRGQTVAVIDSGITYSHYALGGGLGSNHRVVGGWDFTEENDGDIFDDGPSGGHGTHVAGIIGSTDATNQGVASGVDLVGLRVFNDNGAGFYSWVESALRWVHKNRNAFENPITTVNLSLGVSSWNSETAPSWANLEDEFAQLKADGIFIAVSAGNSFTNYNTTGLSYPAASQYVVPVMSVDDTGLLSYFSQRSTRAIAAPGRSITSTAADYKGNGNGYSDDFTTMSGTSMAAPYVAGASTLVRQAMEFVGMTNINEDTIYNQLMATADSVADAATGLTFKRLNLGRAISSLMPSDDFGSTVATAYNMGTLSGGKQMSGVISTLSDADCFTFTASATGAVTFNLTNQDHQMAGRWTAYDAQGTAVAAQNTSATAATFQVVAGQKYTVSLASTGGLGYYSFDVSAQGQSSSGGTVDWGVVTLNQQFNETVNGERWYRVQASQAGLLTAVADFAASGGKVNLEFYNLNRQLVATSSTAGTTARIDAAVAAGESLILHLVGANNDVDFRLANVFANEGGVASLTGTTGDDAFTVSAANGLSVSVLGISYSVNAGSAGQIQINGGAGNDSLAIVGSAGAEKFYLSPTSAQVLGSNFTLNASGFEAMSATSGGGNDSVQLYDSAGDDNATLQRNTARMTGAGYANTAYNFKNVSAWSRSGGNDTAQFLPAANGDAIRGDAASRTMSGAGYVHNAMKFKNVVVGSTTQAVAGAGANASVNGLTSLGIVSPGGDSNRPLWSGTTSAGTILVNADLPLQSSQGLAMNLAGSRDVVGFGSDGAAAANSRSVAVQEAIWGTAGTAQSMRNLSNATARDAAHGSGDLADGDDGGASLGTLDYVFENAWL